MKRSTLVRALVIAAALMIIAAFWTAPTITPAGAFLGTGIVLLTCAAGLWIFDDGDDT